MRETRSGPGRAICGALGLVLALAVAGVAAADMGLLSEKDVAARRVVIDGRSYSLAPDAEVRGLEGERLTLGAFPEPELGVGRVPVEYVADPPGGLTLRKLQAVEMRE